MKSRTILYSISIIAIIALLFTILLSVLSPPEASNQIYIRIGDTDWKVDDDPIVNGKSIWAEFADYERDPTNRPETIKLYDCIYWGAIISDKETMYWETEQQGTYSSNSLTLNDLVEQWQNSASVFKFKHQDQYFRVSFTIPKLENGDYKYSDITEAWEKGELYQTIEKW